MLVKNPETHHKTENRNLILGKTFWFPLSGWIDREVFTSRFLVHSLTDMHSCEYCIISCLYKTIVHVDLYTVPSFTQQLKPYAYTEVSILRNSQHVHLKTLVLWWILFSLTGVRVYEEDEEERITRDFLSVTDRLFLFGRRKHNIQYILYIISMELGHVVCN